MLASSLALIRDRCCPRCGEGRACPILKNLLNEDRKASDEEKAKFIKDGECRYFRERE